MSYKHKFEKLKKQSQFKNEVIFALDTRITKIKVKYHLWLRECKAMQGELEK